MPPKKMPKCRHGRNPHYCQPCGGKFTCAHSNNRNVCKVCRKAKKHSMCSSDSESRGSSPEMKPANPSPDDPYYKVAKHFLGSQAMDKAKDEPPKKKPKMIVLESSEEMEDDPPHQKNATPKPKASPKPEPKTSPEPEPKPKASPEPKANPEPHVRPRPLASVKKKPQTMLRPEPSMLQTCVRPIPEPKAPEESVPKKREPIITPKTLDKSVCKDLCVKFCKTSCGMPLPDFDWAIYCVAFYLSKENTPWAKWPDRRKNISPGLIPNLLKILDKGPELLHFMADIIGHVRPSFFQGQLNSLIYADHAITPYTRGRLEAVSEILTYYGCVVK